MEPTIYEAMGGADALLALAEAWHGRCLADPILAHPFEGEIHPQHTERLAAYWSEQLGGPATYTESLGDYSHVVRVHSGNGPHEQMDGRAVAAFVLALDDVGIPTDPRLRFQLIAWFTWATAMLNHRWVTSDEVPERPSLAQLGLGRDRRLVRPGTGSTCSSRLWLHATLIDFTTSTRPSAGVSGRCALPSGVRVGRRCPVAVDRAGGATVSDLKGELHRKLHASQAGPLSKLEDLRACLRRIGVSA